jgi:hypothetical protein
MVTRAEFERELRSLESELKRLEADYNMFFAGRLPRLPWEQRAKVDALVKRIDRMPIQNTGDRFRFQTVQSRWAAFSELWERQLKAQELGRRPGQRMAAPAAAPPPPQSPPPSPPPGSGSSRERVVAVQLVTDPWAQEDRVQALYERLVQARRDIGQQPVEYTRFTELVRAQVRKLGGDGREVAFRVALKDGKVTLSAKVVDTTGPEPS